MKKVTGSQSPKPRYREIESFNAARIAVAGFQSDLTPEIINKLVVPGSLGIPFPTVFQPIETLGVIKTRGLGRTNLTLAQCRTFQADAAVPQVSFDSPASGGRKPAVQMHFEPGAYGITSTATYFMEFSLAFRSSTQGGTFTRGGGGGGIFSTPGPVQVQGRRRVTLVFTDVPPTAQIFGFLQEESGDPWDWFSVSVSFPPLFLASKD